MKVEHERHRHVQTNMAHARLARSTQNHILRQCCHSFPFNTLIQLIYSATYYGDTTIFRPGGCFFRGIRWIPEELHNKPDTCCCVTLGFKLCWFACYPPTHELHFLRLIVETPHQIKCVAALMGTMIEDAIRTFGLHWHGCRKLLWAMIVLDCLEIC